MVEDLLWWTSPDGQTDRPAWMAGFHPLTGFPNLALAESRPAEMAYSGNLGPVGWHEVSTSGCATLMGARYSEELGGYIMLANSTQLQVAHAGLPPGHGYTMHYHPPTDTSPTAYLFGDSASSGCVVDAWDEAGAIREVDNEPPYADTPTLSQHLRQLRTEGIANTFAGRVFAANPSREMLSGLRTDELEAEGITVAAAAHYSGGGWHLLRRRGGAAKLASATRTLADPAGTAGRGAWVRGGGGRIPAPARPQGRHTVPGPGGHRPAVAGTAAHGPPRRTHGPRGRNTGRAAHGPEPRERRTVMADTGGQPRRRGALPVRRVGRRTAGRTDG